jgi:hypothetical protein
MTITEALVLGGLLVCIGLLSAILGVEVHKWRRQGSHDE